MHNPSSSLMKPVASSSTVHIGAGNEQDTMVDEQRVARIRRRPVTKARNFKVPPDSTILTISSDSSEGEGPDVDPKLVQSFHDINLGEKLPSATLSTSLVTVEVQTEISIPPKAMLERTMVDMVVNKLIISTRDVATNQSNQGTASMQGGKLSPPCPVEQPTMKEKFLTSKKKIVATKKMIFGQPYKVAPTVSLSPISVAPCLPMHGDVRNHEDVSSSSASTSNSFKPCCPPAYNTRLQTKLAEKVVENNL